MSIQDQAKTTKFMSVGAYTYGPAINIRTWRGSMPEPCNIVIGKFCSFADNITFFTGGNHPVNFITTFPLHIIWSDVWPDRSRMLKDWENTNGDIVIGNDVWIGSGVTVMSGVTIGHGAVIGTRSVVASDVPPYGIAVGNPARVVKYRFNNDIISKLLEIKWWDWPVEKIYHHRHLLFSSDVEKLCQ